jgi:hypothetical protein
MRSLYAPGFLGAVAFGAALASTVLAQQPVVRWVSESGDSNRMHVEVTGLSETTLQRLSAANREPAQWHTVLVVVAEQGDLMVDATLPPMLGTYRVQRASLRFEPQFPLEPGVHYRAILKTAGLPGDARNPEPGFFTATHRVPERRTRPTTFVSQVYPSGDVLPENLLKFYVHFSAPMSGGHIYDHIRLRTAAGKDIELPFLEIDEELWDPTMTRLTLFIDPGRIKRGVEPLESIGPALEAGQSYALVIQREWKDSTGSPLKEPFQKVFRVGPPDRDPPDPARWKVQPPAAGTREPLTITFPEPMDHALAQRVIRPVLGSDAPLDGETALDHHEQRWSFKPHQPWPRGQGALLVQKTIEDLAGNNIGKTFDVDLFEGIQRRFTNAVIRLPFEVR